MHDDTSLSEAMDFLIEQLAPLSHVWTGEHAALAWPLGDVIHHVSHAMLPLDEVAREPALLAPHAAFEVMSDDARVLAREAYLSVLALGGTLRRAREDRHAPPEALDGPDLAVWQMLEELTPFVSRADGGLRAAAAGFGPQASGLP